MAMEWTAAMEDTEDMQDGKYLTFISGKDTFALEIRRVIEIIGMQPITPLPETPQYIKGIINLRGQIIAVADLNIKFRKKFAPYDEKTCIIVVCSGEEYTGLIVECVADVVTINDEDIEPLPEKGMGVKGKYLRGIGNTGSGIKLILDMNKLFC